MRFVDTWTRWLPQLQSSIFMALMWAVVRVFVSPTPTKTAPVLAVAVVVLAAANLRRVLQYVRHTLHFPVVCFCGLAQRGVLWPGVLWCCFVLRGGVVRC